MISLDKIVRGILLQKQLSIHFYLQYLVYERDCLREISMDALKVVQYELLTIDEWNEAPIPCGFLDDINVGFEVGQGIRPLVKDNSLNSLINYDDSGNRISFNQAAIVANPRTNFLTGQENINLSAFNWGEGWNYYSRNDYGESLGRILGYRCNPSDTYKIIPERNVIKINEDIGTTGSKFVLTYISDGSCCNAATCVTPYAISTIDAYIKWQTKENNRSYSEGEKERAERWYLKQRGILVGRLSDLTLDDILRSMQRAYGSYPHT